MKTTSFQINYNSTIELRITFMFSVVNRNRNRSLLITLLLTIFHVDPTTTELFIAADNHLCPLLISVHTLCYQSSCHTCFQVTNVVKFVVAKTLFEHCKEMTIVRQKFSCIIIFSVILLITKLQAIQIYFLIDPRNIVIFKEIF